MPLSGKELVRLARDEGWEVVRVKGSHYQLKKDGIPGILTIPVHGNPSLKRGLEAKILKDLGLRP